MKILTWNVERKKKAASMLNATLYDQQADILVLTETHTDIYPVGTYKCVASSSLPLFHDGVNYKAGENRTTIWSRFPFVKTYSTFDHFTAVCTCVDTPLGPILFYGTIIGILGGQGSRFTADLTGVENDLKIHQSGPVCLIGDMNTTFSGYTYPSYAAREKLKDLMGDISLECLTQNLSDNVDHIAITKRLLSGRKTLVSTFNNDKKLSDHIGVCLTIEL